MKKVFILDTNILLSNPRSIFKFEEHDVVIPISVIEEIDTFKKDQSETGRNAREVSRILDRLRQQGTLSAGVPLKENDKELGLLFVYLGYDIDVLPGLLENSTDNHILSIGLTLQKKFGEQRKVVVITKDSNLRIKSDAFGLSSEDFEADKVDVTHLYTGVKEVHWEPEAIHFFRLEKEISYREPIHPNEFLKIINQENPKEVVYGVYRSDREKVCWVNPRLENIWGITPRNAEQIMGLSALLDDRIRLVTLTGGAGTGKTLLAIAAGLSKVTDEDEYHKLLIARPIFALGKDVGFLPGDLEEKLNPWMQPVYDSLDFLLSGNSQPKQKRMNRSYHELMTQGVLAVEPLTYIRGRSLPNAFFVVDESQNLTPHEIKTIITRAGDGTKIILTGDPFQIDNPYIDSTNNGLTYVVERFKNSNIAAHVTFKKGERSELATLAADLL